jgi:glycosyltransferase involved in cell wall biosynthesis
MYLTVVLPVFNEEGSIEATIHRILNTIRPLNWAFEILIVNDGSSDSTLLIAETLRREFESIEIVNLARNSGHIDGLLPLTVMGRTHQN